MCIIDTHFFLLLLFGEAILQSNDAVKGVGILGILAEITCADKLELLAVLGVSQGRLNKAMLQLYKGLRIEIIIVGLVLGDRKSVV